MPVVITDALIRGAGGIEQPPKLISVDQRWLIPAALPSMSAEARAEHVASASRPELDPAVKALSDPSPPSSRGRVFFAASQSAVF